MNPIQHELRALDTRPPALRSFGRTVGIVFIVIAAFLSYRSGWALPVSVAITGGIGTVLLVLGAIVPRVLRPVYKYWMALAFAMGFVMTRVLLSLVFFLLVTPIGLVLRLTKHDPLRRRKDATLPTYWIPREDPPDRDSLRRSW